ncbi:MAG: GTP-binding protein, partial [Betaproteobacteria bacterium]|nr:GTP-binding protein [Betaproteobacteria bacterium]
MPASEHPPLPVTVIGGYLGAGKTTLVNHLLRHAGGKRLAVLVNDFGELPIDADLIESQNDAVISLAGGCLCCSFGSDLLGAVNSLTRRVPRPDQLLIEASGVALPDAIAASLSLLREVALDA